MVKNCEKSIVYKKKLLKLRVITIKQKKFILFIPRKIIHTLFKNLIFRYCRCNENIVAPIYADTI